MRALLVLASLAVLAALPAPALAGISHVHIQGFAFDAGTITIPKGESVTWDNHDGASHTVTSDDNRFPSSPTLGKGAMHTVTFPAAGTFGYHCAIHPSMKGKVEVLNEAPANRAPAMRIDFPASGGVVRGIVEFVGVATDPDSDALTVEVAVDDQPFRPAEGANPWRYRWDSRTVPDGEHRATARAADGTSAPALASVSFRVANADANATAGAVRIDPLVLRPSSTVRVGETAMVSARFTSLVDEEKRFSVRFLVLGNERDRQEVTLPARGTFEVEFGYRAERTGLHEITVHAPSLPLKSVGTLDVLGEDRAPAPSSGTTGNDGKIVVPGPGALAALAAAAGAFALSRRR